MRVLIFQHVPCEHPGQLRTYLKADGAELCIVELDQNGIIPDLDPFDALWVMGGPMDVWEVQKYPWLLPEKEAIRRWVCELQRPFLGVCLGHQLLADVLGGKCELQQSSEIGISEIELTDHGKNDPLFAGMPSRQKVLQWHSVNVIRAPEGARTLAASRHCAIQAMSFGRCAWSIQYHVEAEPDTVENWGAIPEYHRALEVAAGTGALEKLRSDTNSVLPALRETSSLLFRNFRRAVSSVRGV
jgi:GMP synthase-like glutamine amidotransferase